MNYEGANLSTALSHCHKYELPRLIANQQIHTCTKRRKQGQKLPAMGAGQCQTLNDVLSFYHKINSKGNSQP
jgi:hypothetical protein